MSNSLAGELKRGLVAVISLEKVVVSTGTATVMQICWALPGSQCFLCEILSSKGMGKKHRSLKAEDRSEKYVINTHAKYSKIYTVVKEMENTFSG